MTDMTLRMNFHLDGAANKRRRYSAVKIITQAVSKQKNTILYRSPQDMGPRLGRIPHGTKKSNKFMFGNKERMISYQFQRRLPSLKRQ